MKDASGKVVPPYEYSDFPDWKCWVSKEGMMGKGNIVLTSLLGGRIEPRNVDFEMVESTPEYALVKIIPRVK